MKDNEILVKILKINKLIMILLIFILIVLTLGVSKMYYNENLNETVSDSQSEYNTDYDVSMFTEIKAKDIKNKTKKSTEVIYIGRETCSWCAAFLPALWQAQDDYGYTTLYIDIAKIIDFSNGSVIDQDSFDILNNLDNLLNDSSSSFIIFPFIFFIRNMPIINIYL